MKIYAVIVSCMIITLLEQTGSARAQTTNTQNHELAVKVIKQTGAASVGRQIVSPMLKTLLQALNAKKINLPPEAINEMHREILAVFRENEPEMINMIADIYTRHFNEGELLELSEFYGTSLGKKLIKTLPAITQESIEAGRKWGAGLQGVVAQRIKKVLVEGDYLPKK